MSNQLNKILGIIAGVLGGILVISLAVILLRGGRLSDVFDFDSVFTRQSSEETGSSPEAPSTDPAATGESTVPVTEPPVIVEENTLLRVGVSALEGNFNPFLELDEGDADVTKLIGINLLTRDRTGNVILMATEGEYSYYNNERYLYTGPADITVDYDETSDETTYTLKLRDGIYFSDGVKLTVDDLIFNLYVRLQPNFEGNGSLRSYDIVGLRNYYYNNSTAESITVTDADVAAELASPSDEVASFIKGIIVDTLTAEAEQCQKIWSSYILLGYGDSVQEFFYNLYGIDLNYSLVGKSLSEVCQDVIDSYGLDYRKLAENYAVNANYFDERIETYVREFVLHEKMEAAGAGEPVDYISGIVRLGDYTVKLRLHGYTPDAVYELFDMVIAPMHYYGDPALYDYDSHSFGFERGNFSLSAEVLANPLGAGPYKFAGYDGTRVYLTQNEYYYKETADIDFLTVEAYGNDALAAVSEDRLDIVVLNGSREVYEALRKANSNGLLVGDSLYAEEIFDLGYSYIGVNANHVKVGDDKGSEASVALRTALLTAISAFREVAYGEYFSESVRILDYPVSPFFGLAPEKRQEGYSAAFASDINGNRIYQDKADVNERYTAAIGAVKEFLLKAGFTFNEETGKFTEAPAGASLRYEVMVCGDQYSTHPSYGTLAYAKSVLYALGISLDIRYVTSEEDMLVNLYLGEADIWCASWNCVGDPNFDIHYGSEGGSNLYGIEDEALNAALARYAELADSDDQEGAREAAIEIMNRVRSWAVELPCYVLLDYLVYNVHAIDVSTLPTGHSAYWTWMDDVAFITVYPTNQQSGQ